MAVKKKAFSKKKKAKRVNKEETGQLIRARAQKLYEERGGKNGDQLGDWLEAEKQIKSEKGI